jgi:hypothetical protein
MGNVKSTIIHKDDDYKYCGEVVHTKGRWYAEGKGCFESKGYIYTGTFKQNQIWGVGTCTYADGIVYTGSWKTGFKHGKGKLQFPAGDCYEGEFKFDSIPRVVFLLLIVHPISVCTFSLPSVICAIVLTFLSFPYASC